MMVQWVRSPLLIKFIDAKDILSERFRPGDVPRNYEDKAIFLISVFYMLTKERCFRIFNNQILYQVLGNLILTSLLILDYNQPILITQQMPRLL